MVCASLGGSLTIHLARDARALGPRTAQDSRDCRAFFGLACPGGVCNGCKRRPVMTRHGFPRVQTATLHVRMAFATLARGTGGVQDPICTRIGGLFDMTGSRLQREQALGGACREGFATVAKGSWTSEIAKFSRGIRYRCRRIAGFDRLEGRHIRCRSERFRRTPGECSPWPPARRLALWAAKR